MKRSVPILCTVASLWMRCCSSSEKSVDANSGIEEEMKETTEGFAAVTDVSISGEENQYTFSVTMLSPDLGC